MDCYHNQILTSPSPDLPLTEWTVLTAQINRGHTIAGDGSVFLADDTDNNRILVFEKKDGRFFMTQTFENIGIRPHYVVYDESTGRFYALSSMTGELYIFVRPENGSRVALEKVLSVPELSGAYVRSFTIDGNDIYFVSGNGSILRARKKDLKITGALVRARSDRRHDPLTRIQDYFYITVSTDLLGNQDAATILRGIRPVRNGHRSVGRHLRHFIGGGTPYYIPLLTAITT